MDFYLLGVITNTANLVLVIPVLFITFLNMCHLWLVCHLLRFVRAAIIAFLCLSLGLSLAGEETSKQSVCSGLCVGVIFFPTMTKNYIQSSLPT